MQSLILLAPNILSTQKVMAMYESLVLKLNCYLKMLLELQQSSASRYKNKIQHVKVQKRRPANNPLGRRALNIISNTCRKFACYYADVTQYKVSLRLFLRSPPRIYIASVVISYCSVDSYKQQQELILHKLLNLSLRKKLAVKSSHTLHDSNAFFLSFCFIHEIDGRLIACLSFYCRIIKIF